MAAAALIEQKNGARGEIPNYVGCALVLLERLLVKVKEERERERGDEYSAAAVNVLRKRRYFSPKMRKLKGGEAVC